MATAIPAKGNVRIFRAGSGALGALVACLIAATAGAATLSVNPTGDAFVTTGPDGSLSDNNYGRAGALAISGSPESKGTFKSVIRFDLSGIKNSFDTTYGAGLWTVQSITLQLASTAANNTIFNGASTGHFSIVWMQNDAWTEGSGSPNAPGATGITYNSLPTYLGAGDQTLGTFDFDATASGGDGTISIYTLDLPGGILSDVDAGGVTSFEFLAATSGVSYLFNSSSFPMLPRRPVLTIVAAAVPEPAGLFLLGLGGGLIVVSGLHRRKIGNAD